MTETTQTRRLDAGQEAKIAKLIEGNPRFKDRILENLRGQGIDTREFEPIDLLEEGKALVGGLQGSVGFTPSEGLGQEETRAGDIDILGARFQPSRLLGEAAPAILGGGLASVGLRAGGKALAKEGGKSLFKGIAKRGVVGREAFREGAAGLAEGASREIGKQIEDEDRTFLDGLFAVSAFTLGGAALGAGGAAIFKKMSSGIKKIRNGETPTPDEAEAIKFAAEKAGRDDVAYKIDFIVTPGGAAVEVGDTRKAGFPFRGRPKPKQSATNTGPLPNKDGDPDIVSNPSPNDVGPNPIKPIEPGQQVVPAGAVIRQLGAGEPQKLLPPSPMVRPGGVVIIDDTVVELAPTVQSGATSFQEAATRLEDSIGRVVPDAELSQSLTHATTMGLKALQRGDIAAGDIQIFTRDVMTSKNKAEALEKISRFAVEPDESPIAANANAATRFQGAPKTTAASLEEKITQATSLDALADAVKRDIPAAIENGSINQDTANRMIAQATRRGNQIEPGQQAVNFGQIRSRGSAPQQSIVVELNTGETLNGEFIGLVGDRTVAMRMRQSGGPGTASTSNVVHLDMKDIKNKSVFADIAGGAPDPTDAIPSTPAQVRKHFGLVDEIKKMGGDPGKVEDATKLSRRKLADRIGELELQRTKLREKLNDAKMNKVNAARAGVDDVLKDPTPTNLNPDSPDALDEGWYKDISTAYAKMLTPEHSMFGLLSNIGGKIIWELGQVMERNVVKKSRDFLERISAVTGELTSQQKFHLVRALDGATEGLTDQAVADAARQVRPILDEVADMLGLEKGMRIREYFPHMFQGELGKFRAIKMAQELDSDWAERLAWRQGSVDRIRGRYDVETGAPLQRFFGNVLQRQGVDGYELDFDKAIHAYVNGAVRKVEMDTYLDKALAALRKIPTRDRTGRKLEIRKYAADHIAWVSGQPTSSRNLLSKAFHDNEIFNSTVDRLVEWVGGASERGLMGKARRLDDLGKKLGNGTITAAERAEFKNMKINDSLNFLEKLQTDAQKFLKGEKQTRSVKQMRANIALGLDRFRKNLGNPLARGTMAAWGYRAMLLTKLGMNFSHFLVNLTQTAVNTWPLLNTRAVTNGITGIMHRNRAFTGGRTADAILRESGLLLDPVEFAEFAGRNNWSSKAQEVVMAGTRKSEEWNRGIALLGGYHDFLAKKGIKGTDRVSDAIHKQAMEFGVNIVERTQFPFNRAGTPRLFRSPGAKLLFQFMTYPMHQTNFSAELIRDAIKNGNWSPLLKQSMAYMTLFGLATGSNTQIWERTAPPAWDILSGFSDDTFGETDMLESIFGPAGTALIAGAKGNWEQAANQAISGPTATRGKQLLGIDPVDKSRFIFGGLFEEPPRPKRKGIQ